MKRILALLPVISRSRSACRPRSPGHGPVSGPVLEPFAFDRGNPYAGGQHRGADIGASVARTSSRRRAGRSRSRGSTPGGGLTIAIEPPTATPPRSYTSAHLLSGEVLPCRKVPSSGRSARPVRPSRRRTFTSARIASDEHGYVDPLAFLPGRPLHLQLSLPQVLLRRSPAARPLRPTGRPRPQPRGRSEPRLSRGPRAARSVSGVLPSMPSRPGRRGRRQPSPRAWARAKCSSAGGAVAAASGTHWCVRGRGERVGARRLGHPSAETWALLVVLFGAGVLAAGLRRQVRDAVAAHGAPAVFAQAVSSAEDAGRLRPGQHDHVVMDRDLERVLLAEAHALPDLDRNHDATEVVDVANDAVVFWWACEEAARNAARAPIVVVGRPSRLARFDDSPRQQDRKPPGGMRRGPPYDCRGELLPHDAHLLRQFDAPCRPRLHDHRDRHPRPPPAPAGRRPSF